MYERLPVPFGLARFGIAPDHPDTKVGNVLFYFFSTYNFSMLHFIFLVSASYPLRSAVLFVVVVLKNNDDDDDDKNQNQKISMMGSARVFRKVLSK